MPRPARFGIVLLEPQKPRAARTSSKSRRWYSMPTWSSTRHNPRTAVPIPSGPLKPPNCPPPFRCGSKSRMTPGMPSSASSVGSAPASPSLRVTWTASSSEPLLRAAILAARRIRVSPSSTRLYEIVHGTTYEALREVSPLLGSRTGLSTAENPMADVAAKLAERFRLADAAGLLRDPEQAVARMRKVMAVRGIDG